MRPIAIFYHCLFFKDNGEPFDRATNIVLEQMVQMKQSALYLLASHFVVGVNGGAESIPLSDLLIPKQAQKVYHGLSSKSENLTIMELEKWASTHPGWLVLYFHAKGSTYPEDSTYGDEVADPWRRTMMHYLVTHWKSCVVELENGNDVVCCQWLWGLCDGSQHIPAGNFLWATSDFIRSLPSLTLRERIKMSGISALESRHEAEVYWGNGRLPRVFQILPDGGYGMPSHFQVLANPNPHPQVKSGRRAVGVGTFSRP